MLFAGVLTASIAFHVHLEKYLSIPLYAFLTFLPLQLHHADKFEGVPFGLFLGPQVCGSKIWRHFELEF